MPAKKMKQSGRSPLLLITGLFILGMALALLLFGSQIFTGRQGDQAAVLEQVPSSRGVNREDIPLPGKGAPLNVGDSAHNFSLMDLDGREVTLAEFEGQPVIINFWATWCPPCRLEMPEFQRAFEAHEEDGLVILAVNVAESAEAVRSFFYDEMGYTYTPLLDEESRVAEAYGAVGLPATFFVDAAGEVTAVHRGALTQAQLQSYLEDTIQ